jgi:hypothetical protein
LASATTVVRHELFWRIQYSWWHGLYFIKIQTLWLWYATRGSVHVKTVWLWYATRG